MAARWQGKKSDVEYEDWSRAEIEQECSFREIKGRSAMQKAEMIQALKEHDADASNASGEGKADAKGKAKGKARKKQGAETHEEYDDWSLDDLHDEATHRKLAGRGSMNKKDLIQALKDHDEQGDQTENNAAGTVRSSGPTSTDATKSQSELKKQAPAEKGDRGPSDDRELPVGEQNSRQLGEGQGPVRGRSQPEDVHGRLYSCQAGPEGEDGRLSFLHDNGVSEGVAARVAEGCEVILNGKEATLEDLRRGDHLVVTGSPATSIAATR